MRDQGGTKKVFKLNFRFDHHKMKQIFIRKEAKVRRKFSEEEKISLTEHLSEGLERRTEIPGRGLVGIGFTNGIDQ